MLIRSYQDTDQEKILEILRCNTPQYFSPSEEKDLVYYLNNQVYQYYVVELDGMILGCGGFNLSADGGTGVLSWDLFHPESQGKGFGTALTKFRIEKIKTIKGVKMISVRTSQLMYKFYEKFGLETKEIVKDFWDKGFDLYRMENNINNL